jgi:glycerophosphoryl diester phosphodiesterase
VVNVSAQFAMMDLPPVIGHRGAAAYAPENTLAGFRRARELGCSWVEFDVRLTADGVPVVCHDPHLDRTTTGSGLISGLPLATVRACDAGKRFADGFAGERVPLLAEVLALAVELSLSIDIEIKADRGREYATAAAVADVLRGNRYKPSGLIVSSFLQPAVAAMRELAPLVPRAVLFRAMPHDWRRIAERLGVGMIGADHRRLTRRSVVAIRAAGYPLAAYTVNDSARARLLHGWGVTSVFSDAPDIILKAGAACVPASSLFAGLQRPAVARQGKVW